MGGHQTTHIYVSTLLLSETFSAAVQAEIAVAWMWDAAIYPGRLHPTLKAFRATNYYYNHY